MVAASQPLAVAAGLEILRQGGHAADAAVACAAALNVTEPTSTGLGGDCFALYYEAATPPGDRAEWLGARPGWAHLERLRRRGPGRRAAPYHPYTITVPGACAGWCDLIERLGRPEPARGAGPGHPPGGRGLPGGAGDGVFLGPRRGKAVGAGPRRAGADHRAGAPRTPARSSATRVWRARCGRWPRAAKPPFYQGPIAEAIVAGGAAGWRAASLSRTWRRTLPPGRSPSPRSTAACASGNARPTDRGWLPCWRSNLLEGYDLAGLPPLSAERLHLLIEAMRLAFADTRLVRRRPGL